MTLTKPNATKYDYESSPVIQSKLMRNSLGRGDSGGSSMLGAGVGAMIGSRRGKRRF